MYQRTCSIDGCSSPVEARGWCKKHYGRWWSHGDPLKLLNFADPELAFQARTEQQGSCLIWTGSRNPLGYGEMRVDNKTTFAHRYAWERKNGPIPSGTFIDHTCHNPPCVAVEHLRLASKQENGANRSGARSDSKSGVRNVVRHGPGWRVVITKDGKQHRFGTYSTIEEAAAVAEQARKDLFGDYAGRG